MEHNDLKIRIWSSVEGLLKLAKIHCWNSISGTIHYIVSDFNEFKGDNYSEHMKCRQRINSSKELFDLDAAVSILLPEYYDLYDVNLYIFRSFKKETIVEIQFYRKSNFDADYFALVKDNPPMFHSKLSLLVYAWEGGKFDVNRESGKGIHHRWKNFLFKTFLYQHKVKGKK